MSNSYEELKEKLEELKRSVNKQIEDFNQEFDEEYMTQIDRKEREEKRIIDYVEDNPVFKEKIVDMFTDKKEKEENKRNNKFVKFVPVIVGAALVFGVVLKSASDTMDRKSFKDTAPITYSTLDESPAIVQDSYVSSQIDAYYQSINADPSLKSDEFEDAYRDYERLVYEGGPENEITEAAKRVSTVAETDKINEYTSENPTVPFDGTVFRRSYINDGNLYTPVRPMEQLNDNDELLTYNGNLYKKRSR